MRNLVRTVFGAVVAAEGFAFIAGAALHVGLPVPGPYAESGSLTSALLEGISGAVLLTSAAAMVARKPLAWKFAVAGHVLGVASIALGIATRSASLSTQASHHPPMLILLIVVLVALSIPASRHAIENGKHRVRRRRRVLQTLM